MKRLFHVIPKHQQILRLVFGGNEVVEAIPQRSQRSHKGPQSWFVHPAGLQKGKS